MTDVIVIGGGVIGCAIARLLALDGADVALIDDRAVGQGASRASAGMLAPFTEGQHDRPLQALGVRSLEAYDALIKSLEGEDVTIPYTRAGSIEVADDAHGAARLAEMTEALARDGVMHQRLDHSALHALEPALADNALEGVRIPVHGAVHVPALVEALWRSAETRGAKHMRTRAVAIRGADGVRVTTSSGEVRAPHVVLAAGCWAGQVDLGEGVRVPVHPVRGQLLALRRPEQVLTHAIWGSGCYLVPWPDGTVLVGATVEDAGFDESATAGGVHALLQAAIALVPALAHAEFCEVRVGLRPGTADHRPLVGPSTRVEGLIHATGHYRNGALLAPLTAEAVSDLIAGRSLDPVWAPCRPDRFGDRV